MKRLMHWWDGYTLRRAQRQLLETRRHLARQQSEIAAAQVWVSRELERLGTDRLVHDVRSRRSAL